MKYHPDRNPGREVEFIAKFQAIQAAHEILVDPQQRLKYDTDRLRAGYGKLYGPPKSDFPPRPSNTTKFNTPPPRRSAAPPPQPPRPPHYQAPPSTGAHRYQSYARADGHGQWKQPYDEAQTRADAFRGFQNMKGNARDSGNNTTPGGGATGGWSKFDPRTGQSSAYQATAESWARSNGTGGQKPRPGQGYDAFSGTKGGGAANNHQFPPGMSRAHSTTTPKKKQGFAPGNPGGDEPMAKNTSAYVNMARERPQSTYFEPAPSPTAKKSPLRSQQQQQPMAEDEMPKTPFTTSHTERAGNRYATTGGEKTYFGRVGLDRSASVRNPPTATTATANNSNAQPNPRTNPPSPISPSDSRSRHHSASPKLRPDRSRPFSASSSSSTDDTDGSRAERPKVVPRSRLRPEKLKRGFFAQYNKNNQDSGEIFSSSVPFGGDSASSSAFNPFGERKTQAQTREGGDMGSSNICTDLNDKTKDDGEWERSRTSQDHINDMWGFPRRGSLNTPNPGPGPGGNPNMNPNMTPGSMKNSTMYDPFHNNNTKPKSYSRKWSEEWGFSTPPSAGAAAASSGKKPPLWAYPSSVLPQQQHMLPKKKVKKEENPKPSPAAAVNSGNPTSSDSFFRSLPKDSLPSLSSPPFLKQSFKSINADPVTRDNSFNNNYTAAYPNSNHYPQPQQQQSPLYGAAAATGAGQSPMKSKSHESINMTFSANDWNGKFQGSEEYFAPKPSSGDEHQRSSTRTRGRTNGRSRSASQSKPGVGRNTSTQPPPMPTSSAASSSTSQQQGGGPAPFAEAKFSADKWAQELKNNTWTLPHNAQQQQQQPPATVAGVRADRHSSPKKQTKTTKQRTNVPKPASVSVEVDGEEETVHAADGGLGAKKEYGGGGEAMDIDDDIPAGKEQMNGPPGEPRLVSVEPNNPEWRASARQGQQPQQQQPMGTRSTPDPAFANAKSGNNLLNLSKLNNIAPFTTTNHTGINDLNDLNTTLPFESRPGNTVNTSNTSARLTVRPGDLALPKPPKAPVPPRCTSDPTNLPLDPTQQMRPMLTQKTWDRYVAEMGAYMNEWNAFNRKMLGHFKARQETVETGLSPRWISAVGDSSRLNLDAGLNLDVESGKGVDEAEGLVAGSGKGGFNAYLRGVDEDVVVRKHWDVAWERHRACIVALGEVRDWIRGGGRVGR